MSLRSFAKRFHRSRSRQGKDPDSSGDQDGDESARTASATPESQASDPTASVTRPDPFPLPVPEATASMSMPVPEPAPAPALGPPMHLHSMDGALAELTPMQGQLDSGPSMRKIDKALDTMGDRVTSLTSQADRAMTVMNNVTAIANAAVQGDMAQKIERGIQRFADDLPWLMKALDEVARIHPVVTVAVLAFKAVYALESTRQENDRRVMTLYVEMKDMMMVMVQMKGIENRTHIGLDGRPLKDRLEELAEKTAKNIKDCANLCDTFVKKKLLVKVFKGPVWAEKLSGFVQVFSDRKADFQFALAMHTANSLTDVKRQNYEIQAKLDIVLGLFNKFISTDERRIALEIESKGGRAKVRQDDEALKSLIALEDTIRPQHLGGGEAPRDVVREKTTRNKIALAVDELKIELRQDVEDAVAKNFEAFTGKFELQVEVLQIALERYIRAENDRVIGAVTDAIKQGPHLKIKDLELRKIWQDMGWRGNVKARLFVLTLQDHYRDLFDNMAHAANPDAIANDEWALEYLGHSYLRPLMEAFDDDGSGYVSITEVNKLMDMRPSSLGWSIPHWLAYWAIGWQIASTWYINRIRTATSKMREALPSVLPLNRGDFDYHFTMHWPEAIAATVGFSECEDATLQDRFQEYIKSEEDRIRGNLEKIKYNIDSAETVLLVAGSGRIEKCFFPLVCLILEHDLRKVRMATRIVIVHTELMNMHTTLWHVLRALDRRYNEVSGLFAQKRLDEVEQLKHFASGLFLYIRPHNDLWSLANLRDGCFYISHEHEDGEEPLDSEGVQEQEILPVVDTTMFDEVHDEVEDDRVAPDPVKTILGEWNGFAYTDSRYPTRPMISLRFHHSQKDGDNFICAYGVEFDGDLYNASGTCRQSDDGTIQIEWTIHYPDDLDIHYNGVLLDEFTISGTRIFGDDAESDWSFTLKRISAAHMTLRPSPSLLTQNRYRSLWNYAIAAALHDVRRRLWSWSYFAERRDVRRRYVEEAVRRKRLVQDISTEEYNAKLDQIRSLCTSQEVRLYENICEDRYLTLPYHWYTVCDAPTSSELRHFIEGARCICLTCVPKPDDFSVQVSFCDDPECLGTSSEKGSFTTPSGAIHHTTHDLLKTRTVIGRLVWPVLYGKATAALERIRSPGELPDPPSTEECVKEDDVHADSSGQHMLTEEPSAAVKCVVCQQCVYMGHCWYCLDCDGYLCDGCETKSLIVCSHCRKPFPQREWYCGFKPDDFTCHMCFARGLTGPNPATAQESVTRHVHTHPVVQCKRLSSDPQEEPESEQKAADRRLAKLEERIEQLQNQLLKLENKQEAMQASLLSSFAEVITRFAGADGGSHGPDGRRTGTQ